MSINERPLSPHLQIFKFELPMVASAIHRISGFALCIGFLMLVVWIASAVYSAAAFDVMSQILGSIPGQLVLFIWAFLLIYHTINGVRHLIWDTGRLLEIEQISSSSRFVLVISMILTVAAWIAGGGYPAGVL